MAKVSASAEIGVGVSVSTGDITVKLKFKRFAHQLAVPVKVFDEVSPTSVLTTAGACVCGIVGSYLLFVRPYRRYILLS